MERTLTQRLLAPIVEVRREEANTVLLMFLYSFLAMTAYNIVKPVTRSQFISDLGADNLPYVLLAAGVLIGLIMQGYSRAVALLPRRWVIPVTQGAMAALLLIFWALFRTAGDWVSVAFFLWGLIMGILLISQFWTLANDIYDPRQAKRVFGFIGGGASLGGMTGAGLTALAADNVGTNNLLLLSALILGFCMVVVGAIVGIRKPTVAAVPVEEEGVGGREAIRLLAGSKHLQVIALVIAFAAIGAGIIEQQLNMAAEDIKGRNATDAITALLGAVTFYISLAGFVIQVWLTSRIHRFLGIGFALMILPVSLGATAVVILLNAALWAPAVARVLDSALRYTVDKTTREVLFLPLPVDLKYQAKPFVDVTVDRFAKALSALLMLVLIKPWGLSFDWQQLSYASLAMTVVWIFMAIRARREYLAGFRRSIERRTVEPEQVRLNVADLSTVESLIEELADPDEQRVLYAIDILESLEKRHMVTPLLLRHESPAVRARALVALSAVRSELAERWAPAVERMLHDEDAQVRSAAATALGVIRREGAAELLRPWLDNPNPRLASTAAVVLARSEREPDRAAAEATLTRLVSDTRDEAAEGRLDVAVAIRSLSDARFRHILIPLMTDPNQDVAEEALRSVRALGPADFLFVPTLVSLLRQRNLKSSAREVLVSYSEGVVEVLAHFMADPDEDPWVRRHVPATLARIPCQASMDALIRALGDRDGFLRYKAVAAIEKLRRERPELAFDSKPIEQLALKESQHYFRYLGLHYNLFHRAGLPTDSLLGLALREKTERTLDRIYRLLGLLYPWRDIAAARWALERGDARARSSAAEYLDNLLSGQLRKRLMPALEDLPIEEKVRRGNVALRTRPRDTEETLLQLINDDDQVVAAAAIDLVRQLGIWTLADDIEHVLAHRSAHDWHVFEAASWALAARRLPPERHRSAWLEPLPSVAIADRLRRIPVFGTVWVDELFRIASSGHQVRHAAGKVLYSEGMVPSSAQFLLDGRLTAVTRAGEARDIGPPAPVMFEEVLQSKPSPATIRTAATSVSLELSSEELRTLLAHSTDLVEGLFQMLVQRSTDPAERLVFRGSAGPEVIARAAGGLTPIEKVLVLQRVPPFSYVNATELLQLASIAREVRLESNVLLFGPSETPAIWMVTSGEIALESAADPPLTARPGDVVGIYETLAGAPTGRHGRVLTEGIGLRIARDDFFDLLGQRPDLLQQLFGALFQPPARTAVPTSA